jgi:hypothetical protein
LELRIHETPKICTAVRELRIHETPKICTAVIITSQSFSVFTVIDTLAEVKLRALLDHTILCIVQTH